MGLILDNQRIHCIIFLKKPIWEGIMKTAVVGCGGIGSVVACAASLNSPDVVCIEGKTEYAQKLENRGINLTGKKGNLHSTIKCHAGFPTDSKYDVIILTVKSNVLRDVFTSAKEHLAKNGFIITLQNGVEVLRLHDEHPEVRLAAGAVGYNSIMIDHGQYEVTSDGGITVGNLNKKYDIDLLLSLKQLLEPYIPIDFSKNIEGVLWGKLLIVIGVTGLGGVAGLRVGELLKMKVARKLFYRVVTEGYNITKALGIKVDKFQGGINPAKFRMKGGLPIFFKYMILRVIGKRYRDLKSNIYHSIERGEKTEIDYLNGTVVEYAKKIGMDVPVNEAIVKIIKEIESGKRKMSVQNLYEIYNLVYS